MRSPERAGRLARVVVATGSPRQMPRISSLTTSRPRSLLSIREDAGHAPDGDGRRVLDQWSVAAGDERRTLGRHGLSTMPIR
jgi:hypothetical protein